MLLILKLVEYPERVRKTGECHAVEGPQVDPLSRMVLFMRVEVQPCDLETTGKTGVSLLTFTVVIFLVWTVRTKERPTRDAGVGIGTTGPIRHHERASISGSKVAWWFPWG